MPRNTAKPEKKKSKHGCVDVDLTSVFLTCRERQVLLWVAQGKSSWEIGSIIDCAECTVNFHCRNIMGKLDVYTRAHALVKAIDLGLIDPRTMAAP